MALVKKNNKWYIVLYTSGRQQWISSRTSDRDKAAAMERDLRQVAYKAKFKGQIISYFSESAENLAQEYQPAGISGETIWEQYASLKETKKLSARTIADKNAMWMKFVEWLETKEIRHIELVTRKIALQYMRDGKFAGQRYNNIKHNLSSVFRAVLISADLKENPFANVPTEKHLEHKSYRPFTEDELKAIYNAVSGEWALACLIGQYSGLRFKDVCHLKWENIDGTKEIINLRPAKTTRYGIRTIIPIHPNLQAELSKIADNNSVFIMPGLAANYSQHDQQYYFGTLLTDLKIVDSPEGLVGFHSFRHGFNTELQAAGVDSATREALSGHSSAEINKIYSGSLVPLKEAILKLK